MLILHSQINVKERIHDWEQDNQERQGLMRTHDVCVCVCVLVYVLPEERDFGGWKFLSSCCLP